MTDTWSVACLRVPAGEAHRLAGRGQHPADERAHAAQGALQHADAQRHLAHQPHQATDHRKRGVQEQQQLLEGGAMTERIGGCACVMGGGDAYVHGWTHVWFGGEWWAQRREQG